MSDDSPSPAEHERRAQPESFRARALAASLTVKDLQQSLAWYQDVIGFTADQRHEREGRLVAVSLKAGAVRILLNQDNGAKGWDRVKGEGFSLQFTTAQNVDEIAARIREHGGTLDAEPADMPWGVRAFRLHDPDGYRLSISSERPDSP
jgi:lactoylglutathione lyase